MKKMLLIQVLVIVILAAITAVVFLRSPRSSRVEITSAPQPFIMPKQRHPAEYSFINPAITADLGKHYIINFRPLREDFESIQKKYSQQTYIYFLYLNNGAWVGIDEKELFTAASTLKVPLAMALMKAIKEGRLSLSDSYDLDKLNLDSNFGELYKVGPDQRFSVEDLLKIMLTQSDNTAMNALFEILSRIGVNDPLGEVYGVLGWEFTQEVPVLGEPIDYSKINLKTLANMFLALYNAKYLDVSDSQKILAYLSDTSFKDKIVAGVPENIVVSHKIGTAAPESTFSDCGIVYAPSRHYLLCMGLHGSDEKTAARFMAEISAAAYKYVIHN